MCMSSPKIPPAPPPPAPPSAPQLQTIVADSATNAAGVGTPGSRRKGMSSLRIDATPGSSTGIQI